MDSNIIKKGENIIIRSYDDKSSYIVQCMGDKKINKTRVSLNDIIGKNYTKIFELQDRKLIPVSSIEQLATEYYDPDENNDNNDDNIECNTNNKQQKHILVDTETGVINHINMRGNNSFYNDTNTAQKLSNQDIKKLKDDGISGKHIIQNLIENSSTFASKNEFAQLKWIKKKENKYRRKYKVLRYIVI